MRSFQKRRFPCPCCGCYTLPAQGEFDICPVCFWEDDPFQMAHEQSDDGANHVSLMEARNNYLAFGACRADMLQHVRKPLPAELEPVQAGHEKAFAGLLKRYFGK